MSTKPREIARPQHGQLRLTPEEWAACCQVGGHITRLPLVHHALVRRLVLLGAAAYWEQMPDEADLDEDTLLDRIRSAQAANQGRDMSRKPARRACARVTS